MHAIIKLTRLYNTRHPDALSRAAESDLISLCWMLCQYPHGHPGVSGQHDGIHHIRRMEKTCEQTKNGDNRRMRSYLFT